MWTFTVGQNFTLGNSLFGAVKLSTYADPDKYKYSGYGIGFNASGNFLLSDDSGFGKNVIKFGADVISSVNYDKKKKHILILAKGLTQRLEKVLLSN